jgi:hypothetical protein
LAAIGDRRGHPPEVALTDDSENYLFVGVVPVLLVVWFGIAGGGAWRHGRRLTTSTLAVTSLFILGRYTPFYGLAFTYVPGIDLFRRPTDASFVFGIALAPLAGHCLADYVRHGLPRLRAVAGHCGGFGDGGGHGLGHRVLPADRTRAGRGIRDPRCRRGDAGGALILIIAHRRSARVSAAAFVTLVGVAELVWWNAASRLNAESRSNYAVLEAPTGVEADAIALLEHASPPIIKKANARAWKS